MSIRVLQSAVCPNGRFGMHHVSIEEHECDGHTEYVWRNGFSDPLVCSYEQAVAFFNCRLKDAAFDLLKDLSGAKDDLSRSVRIGNTREFFASINA